MINSCVTIMDKGNPSNNQPHKPVMWPCALYCAYQEFSNNSTATNFFLPIGPSSPVASSPMNAILPVPNSGSTSNFFFFKEFIDKMFQKEFFFGCWLAHCGGFDPCSMFSRAATMETGGNLEMIRVSFLMYFALWMDGGNQRSWAGTVVSFDSDG